MKYTDVCYKMGMSFFRLLENYLLKKEIGFFGEHVITMEVKAQFGRRLA